MYYWTGSEIVAADALSRVCGAIGCPSHLAGLNESLGHPGIAQVWHFIRRKSLPYSPGEVSRHVRSALFSPPQNPDFIDCHEVDQNHSSVATR